MNHETVNNNDPIEPTSANISPIFTYVIYYLVSIGSILKATYINTSS